MSLEVSNKVQENIETIFNFDKPKRTLVIADIHGGFKSFKQVLERCEFNPEEDLLICLGDYVDGWGETAELIEYLLSLESLCKYKPIFLRGNHDAWCQEWLNYGITKDIWVMQGGQATIDSYVRTGFLTDPRHKEFFNRLHNYYIDDNNRGFVHGGFISKNGLGYEAYESDYYWDRTLWEIAMAVDKEFKLIDTEDFRTNPYRFEKHTEIYIGHTSTGCWMIKPHLPEYQYSEQPKQGRIIVPMNRCNVWNMDTGGGFEGRLTIMDVDTKKFWQSDNMKTLYPNERGR